MRILIACPGNRDPLFERESETSPKVKSMDEPTRGKWFQEVEAHLKKIDKYDKDTRFPTGSLITAGPIATALENFSRREESIDRLYLAYSGLEMARNVTLCHRYLPRFLSGPREILEYKFVDKIAGDAFVHKYNDSYLLVQTLIDYVVSQSLESDEICVVLGPATPQLNFALALNATFHERPIRILQAIEPRGRKPSELIDCKFDGMGLPDLSTYAHVMKMKENEIERLAQESGPDFLANIDTLHEAVHATRVEFYRRAIATLRAKVNNRTGTASYRALGEIIGVSGASAQKDMPNEVLAEWGDLKSM